MSGRYRTKTSRQFFSRRYQDHRRSGGENRAATHRAPAFAALSVNTEMLPDRWNRSARKCIRASRFFRHDTGSSDKAQLRAKGMAELRDRPVCDEADTASTGQHGDVERTARSRHSTLVEFDWNVVTEVASRN